MEVNKTVLWRGRLGELEGWVVAHLDVILVFMLSILFICVIRLLVQLIGVCRYDRDI